MEQLNGETCRLSGSVEDITFQNGESGFTVLDLACDGILITVVGVLPAVSVGDELKLVGRYSVHPKFGAQFKAELCERSLPSSASAILRYLSSGGVKGVGPVTARRLVDAFGDGTLQVIEKQPERLAKVRGITPAKAKIIAREFAKQFGLREVLLGLAQFGMKQEEALRVYKAFGAAACDRIRINPYVLCEAVEGFSFERADALARDIGLSGSDPHRLSAGIEHVLRHNLLNGHTCLPRDKALDTARTLLAVSADDVDIACDELTAQKAVIEENDGENSLLFLPPLHQAESYVAGRLSLLMRMHAGGGIDVNEDIDALEANLGMEYDATQREAIRAAVGGGLLVLTGGPGTGKTTTVGAIIQLMQGKGMRLLLAAPTGRAAKRMTELTGAEAKTIHRLLEVEWGDGRRPAFARGEQNPLDCDAVIVDELSMVDAQLFEGLLRALPLRASLVLVGDADQLPSVGAGNVLGDLLESGCIPSVRLTHVFRQAELSGIVANAHRVLRGEKLEYARGEGDFFLRSEHNPYAAAQVAADLALRRLPAAYSFDSWEQIQILCPSKLGEAGTRNLNSLMQSKLNPPGAGKREYTRGATVLREGDKVIQSRNNYDVVWTKDDGQEGSGVFNGDIGRLIQIDARAGTLQVRYDDRTALYSHEDAEDIDLAYAMTIHKSQGSEFECVVLPLCDVPYKLCYRNLLYTAITRARKLLVVVGEDDCASRMITNDRRTKRYTSLCARLREACGKDAG